MSRTPWTATEAGWYRIVMDQPAEYLGVDEPVDDQGDSLIVHLNPGDGYTITSEQGPPPGLFDRPDGVWVDIDWPED